MALVELSIRHIWAHDNDNSTPVALIELTRLRSLTFCVVPFAHGVFNLSKTVLQHLEFYRGSDQCQGSWQAREDFLAILRRTKRGMTNLKLSFQARTELDDLILYPTEMPHLEQLYLGNLGGQILNLSQSYRIFTCISLEGFNDEVCAQVLRGRLVSDPRILRPFKLRQQTKLWLLESSGLRTNCQTRI